MANNDANKIYAKTSAIEVYLKNFSNDLIKYKADIETKLNAIQTLANSVSWQGEEAKQFKEAVAHSANMVKNSSTKVDPIIKELDAKAKQFQLLLNNIKAQNNIKK